MCSSALVGLVVIGHCLTSFNANPMSSKVAKHVSCCVGKLFTSAGWIEAAYCKPSQLQLNDRGHSTLFLAQYCLNSFRSTKKQFCTRVHG